MPTVKPGEFTAPCPSMLSTVPQRPAGGKAQVLKARKDQAAAGLALLAAQHVRSFGKAETPRSLKLATKICHGTQVFDKKWKILKILGTRTRSHRDPKETETSGKRSGLASPAWWTSRQVACREIG